VPAQKNLHYAWDDAVIGVLEKQLGINQISSCIKVLL